MIVPAEQMSGAQMFAVAVVTSVAEFVVVASVVNLQLP